MLSMSVDKEDKIMIQDHGFTRYEFKDLPGTIGSSPTGTTWKTYKIQNFEITFFLDPKR